MFPYLKQLSSRKVSLRAGVAAGIVLLGLFGLVEAGAWELHHVRLKTRVHRALPRVREETSRELKMLTRAIDEYKSRLGCYPPDHLLSQNPIVVDAITNQLLYELLGSVYDGTNDTFSPQGHFPSISGKLVKAFFNVSSFKNSAARPDLVKQFIQSTDYSGHVRRKRETGRGGTGVFSQLGRN